MAKVDVSKIDGYDKMTAEQKLVALEAFDVPDPDYTGFVKKDTFDKTASELAEWKKKHNALLSEEEKKKLANEEQMAAIQKELETLKKEKSVSEAKARFIGLGLDEALAAETAVAMSNGDNDKVFANMKKFNENREKALRVELLNQTPPPPAGGNGGEVTKEAFGKMGYEDRLKLSVDNPVLYKKFTTEQ